MTGTSRPAGAGDGTADDIGADMARVVAYLRAHASGLAQLVPVLRRAEAAGDTAAADEARAQLDQLARRGEALADELDQKHGPQPGPQAAPQPGPEAGPR